MEIYSSDEDIDNEIAHLLVVPDPRLPRQFATRDFDEDVSDKTFRERYRVPREVVNLLEEKLSADLKHATRRNQGLSPRDQIKVFLHFVGTNSFFHVMRDCHGVSTDTVFRTVHRVCNLLYLLREDHIKWPDNPETLAYEFHKVAKMPSVCGALDGTHVSVHPPKAEEVAFVNRKQTYSLNIMAVCGPDLKIFFVSSRAPGRWHDSRVSPSCYSIQNINGNLNTRHLNNRIIQISDFL